MRQEARDGTVTLSGGAPAANTLRRALGVLWTADALVKLALPFGDRPGEQSYEQIMTAESAPPGFHRIFAREANVFLGHPFLWWLPAALELGIGAWLVLRPAGRRALAPSAGWALVVGAAGEGFGGLAPGGSLLAGYPGAALLHAAASVVLFPRREERDGAAARRRRRRRRGCSASGAGCCGSARRSRRQRRRTAPTACRSC